MEKYHFQIVQKLIVFSKDLSSVLLCKRRNEQVFDGVYSFIGGKLETTDKSIIDSLKREKNEEVGEDFKIKVYPGFTSNVLFKGKIPNQLLPHYYAVHVKGEINLGQEYSDYKWVKLEDIDKFEPKIYTIPDEIKNTKKLKKIIKQEEFVII